MAEIILIVDDEPNYRQVLEMVLSNEGYEILTAESGRRALEIFREHQDLDLVLTDMTMPDGNGLDLLVEVKELRSEVPVIMLTAHGTVELAVQAMKQGAFDYLTKPYKNADLIRTVSKALEVSRLGRQNKELREALASRHSFGSLIGKSKPMLDLYQLMEKVAPTKANVLITGESGTGKELVAQAIHYNSRQTGKSFVAVNCSALSESLLESELFGYEKGAFTGAGATRAGRFELASGGTLFLDEVGEMGQSAQVKLLRALQERTIERVGGGTPISVDVRLIAATNRDLRAEVATGRFREDLFYRLNVVHLKLPALRERLDDLPLLVDHFLNKHGQDRKNPISLSQGALRLLYAHRWPGNVRELENVIERGLVLVSGEVINSGDLPEELQKNSQSVEIIAHDPGHDKVEVDVQSVVSETFVSDGPLAGVGAWVNLAVERLTPEISLVDAVTALEEGLLRRAMEEGGGVQSHAADILGLKRNVFKYKWDKYAEVAATSLSQILTEVLPQGLELEKSKDLFEEELLRRAMAASHGVQSQAAEILGLKKNLLQYKLKKYPALG